MEFHDRPLLSYAELSVILLKIAGQPGATLGRAVTALRDLLDAARQADQPTAAELGHELDQVRRDLAAAGLIVATGTAGFRTTPRGQQMLVAHPLGIDQSVLVALPEFRAGFSGTGPRPRDAEPPSYAAGYDAFRRGRRPEDNPHAPDSADHLAWENGWFEARDEEEEAGSAVC
jgi:hypothetical protein